MTQQFWASPSGEEMTGDPASVCRCRCADGLSWSWRRDAEGWTTEIKGEVVHVRDSPVGWYYEGAGRAGPFPSSAHAQAWALHAKGARSVTPDPAACARRGAHGRIVPDLADWVTWCFDCGVTLSFLSEEAGNKFFNKITGVRP